jgi:hypothetical protein
MESRNGDVESSSVLSVNAAIDVGLVTLEEIRLGELAMESPIMYSYAILSV